MISTRYTRTLRESGGTPGDGQRITKTGLGATTSFTWDTAESLPETLQETTGTSTTYYIFGPGGLPVEQVNPDSSINYLHHDQLGSTRLITNASGANVGTYTYSPYGDTTGYSGTATTPYQYAGGYSDMETGFQYDHARYYDPISGAFLSRDPLVAITRTPYGYADSDPLAEIDPTGLCSLNPFSTNDCYSAAVSSVTRTVVKRAKDAGHIAIDIDAVAPYGLYYVSYYQAHALNWAGCHLGSLGCASAHVLALGYVPGEGIGLAGDEMLDAMKGEDLADESCGESDRRYINPLHSFLPAWLQGPSVYLPGVYRDSQGRPHINFEW